MARFTLTDAGLVENVGSYKMLYGNWRSGFGAWRLGTDGGRDVEFIPDWSPFPNYPVDNPRDVFDEDEALFNSYYSDPGWWNEGEYPEPSLARDDAETLASYMGSFPGETLHLATAFQPMTWHLLDVINLFPPFEAFATAVYRAGHMGFLTSMLALSGYALEDRRRRRDIAEQIAYCPRPMLISLFTPHTGTPQAIRALQKLVFGETLNTLHMEALFRCLANPRKAALIAHAASIHPEALNALQWLPDFVTLPNLAFLLESDAGAQVIWLLVMRASTLVRMRGKGHEWLRNAVAALRANDDFVEKAIRWKHLALLGAVLPPPPLQASGMLVPLSTAAAMQREGREMASCLGDASMIEGVVAGDTYLYSWLGSERVTVSLRRTGEEWKIEKILAARNRIPRGETLERVRAAFATLATNPDRRPGSAPTSAP